jgi:MFS family permease
MAIAPVPLSPAPVAEPGAASAPSRRDQLVAAALMAVCFLFNIEGTVVTVAIPRIADELGMTSVEAALTASLYYLGMMLALAPATVLASRYCVKRMLSIATAVFTLGAVVAWRSTSIEGLLVARVLQGVGGGGMAALAYGSVGVWFEPRWIGWAYGRLNAAIGVGMLLGAPVGGTLVAVASWGAIFSVTAAVGVATFACCAIALPQAYHTPNPAPFGPRLARSAVLGLGCAGSVYAMSKLGARGLAAPDVLAAAVVGLLALAATALLEWRSAHPLVPREVWRGGRAVVGLSLVAIARGILVVTNFTVPFLLGVVFGLSTAKTGLLMAVSAGVFAAMSPRGAAIAQRIGPARLVLRGMATSAAAFCIFVAAAAWSGAPVTVAALALAVAGLGTGLAVASASRAAVDAIPPAARAAGGMLLPTAGFVGMAVHVTVVEWIFAWRVPGGFSVVEKAHDAATVALSRPGFVAVFAGIVALAVLGIGLARLLMRLEARAVAGAPRS